MKLSDLNPKRHKVSSEVLDNLLELFDALSSLESEMGFDLIISRGYSTPKEQMEINPKAPNSAHISGQAVDIEDLDKDVWKWCDANLDVLEVLGFYIEDGNYTASHVHLQTRAPASGHRVFIP